MTLVQSHKRFTFKSKPVEKSVVNVNIPLLQVTTVELLFRDVQVFFRHGKI